MTTTLAVAALIAVMAALIFSFAWAIAYFEDKAEQAARRKDVQRVSDFERIYRSDSCDYRVPRENENGESRSSHRIAPSVSADGFLDTPMNRQVRAGEAKKQDAIPTRGRAAHDARGNGRDA